MPLIRHFTAQLYLCKIRAELKYRRNHGSDLNKNPQVPAKIGRGRCATCREPHCDVIGSVLLRRAKSNGEFRQVKVMVSGGGRNARSAYGRCCYADRTWRAKRIPSRDLQHPGPRAGHLGQLPNGSLEGVCRV